MFFDLLTQQPLMFFAMALALLYGLTVHEFAHAAAAKWQGDDTAEQMGRLSLNPLVHIDLMGLLFMFLVGFGWGKPVPVNYARLKNGPKSDMIVSMAGIFTNFVSVFIFMIVFMILFKDINPVLIFMGQYETVSMLAYFFSALIVFNLTLGIFNLIPIPPLDGSHVLFHLLPSKFDNIKVWIAQYGPMVLLALILLDNFGGVNIFSKLFITPVMFIGGVYEVLKGLIM